MAAPLTAVLSGSIYSLSGLPIEGTPVSARLVGDPVAAGITTDPITVKTDSSGTFGITLAQGQLVAIEIPSIGYRKTITVPSADSDLFSL